MKKQIFLFFLLALTTAVFAQLPVGHRQITYQDPARSNRSIPTEIYYPAVTAGENVAVATGEFPIIVFGHGFLMVWSSYDNFWNSIVPSGYIMIFPTTEGTMSPVHADFGADLAFLINTLKAENTNSSSPFYQKIATTSAIIGHSMGGGASFLACENNTVPTIMVTFAAAVTTPSSVTAAANVSIPTIVFSGDNDCVAPPASHQTLMYNALTTNCKIFINILGGGHCYFANSDTYCSLGELTCSHPITSADQHATVSSLLLPLIDYYLKSDATAGTNFVDLLTTSPKVTYIKDCDINPSAINEFKTDCTLNLYPNPSSDLIQITYTAFSNSILTLNDMTGRTLLSKHIEKTSTPQVETFDIKNLKQAVYFIKLLDEQKNQKILRFVKL